MTHRRYFGQGSTLAQRALTIPSWLVMAENFLPAVYIKQDYLVEQQAFYNKFVNFISYCILFFVAIVLWFFAWIGAHNELGNTAPEISLTLSLFATYNRILMNNFLLNFESRLPLKDNHSTNFFVEVYTLSNISIERVFIQIFGWHAGSQERQENYIRTY